MNGIGADRFAVIWDAFHPQNQSIDLVSARDAFKYLSENNHSEVRKGAFTGLYRSAATVTRVPPMSVTPVEVHKSRPCHGASCRSKEFSIASVWIWWVLLAAFVGFGLWAGRSGLCRSAVDHLAQELSKNRVEQSRDVTLKESANYELVDEKRPPDALTTPSTQAGDVGNDPSSCERPPVPPPVTACICIRCPKKEKPASVHDAEAADH